MLTVIGVLAMAALICSILGALNPPKCPWWVPSILISIALLLSVLPKG